ncbi:MAG: NAD(P)H-dependent oxidoreductase [Clostridiaceae bacterium]
MIAYLVSDGEFDTPLCRSLINTTEEYLKKKGFDVQQTTVQRGELASCVGCFGCWIKKPGECVMNDGIGEINRRSMNSDVTIYLCPVVFGQFSANIKNVIDRWLPNMQPFFMTRPDGSTMHPPRYEEYPKQIMVGYGESLDESDAALFTDINKKHRSNVEVLIFRGDTESLTRQLDGIRMERIGGLL